MPQTRLVEFLLGVELYMLECARVTLEQDYFLTLFVGPLYGPVILELGLTKVGLACLMVHCFQVPDLCLSRGDGLLRRLLPGRLAALPERPVELPRCANPGGRCAVLVVSHR